MITPDSPSFLETETPLDNPEIARTLEEVADVLEIQSANPFRIRAYRNAVRTVEGLTTPLRKWVEENRPLTDLQGIGKEMGNHIKEMVETGTLGFRDELLAEVPRSLIELMRLPNLGPKKAKKIYDELKIGSVDELEAAAKAGLIAALPGFGAKSQEKILAGIAEYRQHGSRFLLPAAERLVEPLLPPPPRGAPRGAAPRLPAGNARAGAPGGRRQLPAAQGDDRGHRPAR